MSLNNNNPGETQDQVFGEDDQGEKYIIGRDGAEPDGDGRDDGLDPGSLEAFVRDQSDGDSGSDKEEGESSDWSDESANDEDPGANITAASPSVESEDDDQRSNSIDEANTASSEQSQENGDEVSIAAENDLPDGSDDQSADFGSVTPAAENQGNDEDDQLFPSTADESADDQNTINDEVQSAFSDDSDSDGWDPNEEIAKFRAQTAEIAAHVNTQQEAGEEADDKSNNDPPEDADANHAESSPQEQEEDIFQDKSRPWLRNAGLHGALLPIGAVSDEDLYRRDINFYHYGHMNTSRSSSVDPRSRGKPSLLNPDGTLRRVKSLLEMVRGERNQLAGDFSIIKGELEVAKSELYEDRQQIGMLKHAVDTREKNLKKWKDYAERTAEQWKTAFEDQRPLADAERERRALIEAGYKFQQNADTQTSPIEIAIPGSTENVPSANRSTQTDPADFDIEDHETLSRERDGLISSKNGLLDQVRRLKTLLEESKEWIEARDWNLKSSSNSASQATEDTSRPVSTVTAAPSDSFSSVNLKKIRKTELPLDSVMLDWPQHWIDREEEMRKSRSWIQARDKVEAELNAWQRQLWADANTSVTLCG